MSRVSSLGAVLLAGCASSVDYVTGEATLNRYTLEQDIEIGEKTATLVLAASEALGQPIDPSDRYTRAVRRVAARLLAVEENRARMPPLPWEVHVVGHERANAWCFPGGQVVVFAGLLKTGMVRDEDELAAVLGHELAHAASRHGTERMTIQALRQMIAPLGTFFGTRLVELANPDRGDRVLSGLGVELNEFGKSQEHEADLIGMELVARAGFDPTKAAAIWSRRAREGAEPEQLGGHPTNAARVREIERHVAVARYVAARSTPPPPLAGERWIWTPSDPQAPTSTRTLAATGILPEGPRALPIRVRGRRSVLALSIHVKSGPGGEAPRAEVRLDVARDLHEDRLPFSARLTISSADPARSNAPPIVSRSLALAAPLEGPATQMRIALPRLPPGAYRVRVQAEIGALFTATARRFDIAPPGAQL